MKQVRLLLGGLVILFLVCTAPVFAQQRHPGHHPGARRHPNLAAAHRLTREAIAKITAAQKANEFDMEGHAKKAKELLEEANKELKEAAQEAGEKRK